MNKQPTICFVAGRSGGHLLPCLTKAYQVAAQEKGCNLLFFATSTDLDKKILQHFSLPHRTISLPLDNVPYNNKWQLPLFFWHLCRSWLMSTYHLLRQRPQKIVSMGGYISIPVCIAATMLRIPIELYELNAVPGKAVTFLAPLARTIFVCFEESKKYLPIKKCTFAQYPVRFSSVSFGTQKEALAALGLDMGKKTILVLGGSQGSLFLNNLMKNWLATAQDFSAIQIIHQTGAHDKTDWQNIYATKNITALIFDYTHEIEHMYRAADIILCRAGAGTLFEVCFFGKKCITIPLETATTDHQKTNAYALAQQYPHLITVLGQQEVEQHQQKFFALLHENL
jgi:UDP-N-acetylglucosamine--N-acetylmuramyl-(pentapeptide) pyrophosphoryl-undecaprenol N-acetylglucosamine transferase